MAAAGSMQSSSLPSVPVSAATVFQAPIEGFSASFPTRPQVIGHAPETDEDSGYWVYADQGRCAAYRVRVDQYPKNIRVPAPDQRAYDLILRAHAVESSSHLRSERAVAVGGQPGLEGEFVGAAGGGERIRVVMLGRRVYQVSYTQAAGGRCDEADAFLASFQITTR
jgi:hypothetical protein